MYIFMFLCTSFEGNDSQSQLLIVSVSWRSASAVYFVQLPYNTIISKQVTLW